MFRALLIAIVVACASPALAHPGAVDTNGGHWDHRNNVYICHRAGCVPPSCDGNSGGQICGNRFYGQGNYVPGNRSRSTAN
jgi:hypothetical protein